MSDYEERGTPNLKYGWFPSSVEGLGTERLKSLIASLNDVSDRLGCVIFEGDSDVNACLVVFAGNLERFAMLRVAQNVRCKVIYLQDTIAWGAVAGVVGN